MSPRWCRLAGAMLELASEHFSNHGCNDRDFPADWSLEERRQLVKAMHEGNGTPGEYEPDNLNVPDYRVMSFLADRLAREGDRP